MNVLPRTSARPVLARVAVAATAALMLVGCGTQTDDSGDATGPDSTATATETPTETPVAAPTCPENLPNTDDTTGPASSSPATELPSLGAIEAAWLCTYFPAANEGGDEGEGGSMWRLQGEQQEITGDDLTALTAQVGRLALPKENRACTVDLGPRSLFIVRTSDGDLGVQIDRFGCSDVRLTSDLGAVAGTTSDLGTVPGVLQPSRKLVKLLDRVAPR